MKNISRLNREFKAPSSLGKDMRKYLLITVDAEEEFNWREFPYLPNGGGVRNIRELWRLQEGLGQLDAKATYFVDFPVLKDPEATETLGAFHTYFGAELGSHLHPWCTPPFEEKLIPANTMANRLPARLLRAKLEALTHAFGEAFGFPPLSYRAGRFGFDRSSAEIIGELGYQIDSSVTPLYDWSRYDGPNFFYSPVQPFFLREIGTAGEEKTRGILEIPISAGFNHTPVQFWRKIYESAQNKRLRRLKVPGIMDRCHLLKRINLNPELHSLDEMKNLVKTLYREKVQVFTMIFHSSSFIPHGNSQIRTPEQVSAFIQRILDFVSWMVLEFRAESLRMSDLLRSEAAAQA